MKQCPSCKSNFDDSKKFCRNCGVALLSDRLMDPEIIAKRQSLKNRVVADPTNPELLSEYGDFLGGIGVYDEALVQYYSVLESDPSNIRVRRKIIEIYKRSNAIQKVSEQLGQILRLRPDDLDLQEELAGAHAAAGNKVAAEELLTRMIRTAPSNLRYLNLQRDLLKELGRTGELEAVCRRIVDLNPSDLSSWIQLAELAREKGSPEEENRASENILRIDPSNIPASYYLGVARHESARKSGWEPKALSEAVRLLRKAVEGADSLSNIQANTALVYLASAEFESGNAAPRMAADLKEIDPRSLDPDGVSLLATCLIAASAMQVAAGQTGDALVSLDRSIQIKDSPLARKKLGEVHTLAGDAHLKGGNPVLALEEYEHGLRFSPDDAGLQQKAKAVRSRQKLKKGIRLSVASAAVLAAGLAVGYFAYDRLVLSKQFTGQIRGALAEGRFFEPAGNSVEDLYRKKKAETPDSPELKEAASMVRERFAQEGEVAFKRLYDDSDDSGWDKVERIYAFLGELYPGDREIEARMEFSRAHGIIKGRTKKNYIEAMTRYQKALTLKPNWVLALNGVAKVYVRKDSPYYNKSEALAQYAKACQVDPNFPWGYTNMAAIYSEDRQWELAEQALMKAVSIKGTQASILSDLGQACERQGRIPDACRHYQEAVKYEKNPEKLGTLQRKIRDISSNAASQSPSGEIHQSGSVGHYVIGMSTTDVQEANAESQRRNGDGFATFVCPTSGWSGFSPGYYIVVYGIYSDGGAAESFVNNLQSRGINAYSKHSGTKL